MHFLCHKSSSHLHRNVSTWTRKEIMSHVFIAWLSTAPRSCLGKVLASNIIQFTLPLRSQEFLIQYLKGCHREEGINGFSMAPEGRTRTHGWKFNRGRSNLEIRRNFLRVRTVKQWSSLPPDVVGAPSLEVFKKRLDSHLPGMLWAGGWTRRPPRSLPNLRQSYDFL